MHHIFIFLPHNYDASLCASDLEFLVAHPLVYDLLFSFFMQACAYVPRILFDVPCRHDRIVARRTYTYTCVRVLSVKLASALQSLNGIPRAFAQFDRSHSHFITLDSSRV